MHSIPENTLSRDSVKLLGRALPVGDRQDCLWLCHSGTGAEFAFHGCRCEVTITGDSNADPAQQGSLARIAICVDGVRVIDDIVDAPEKTYTVLEAEKPRDAVVRIVKLSETAMATCGISAIRVDDPRGIRPTPDRGRRLEFIGDSITCGYGVDDEDPAHPFSTATEDATRAYAIRTAALLNADYSLVSISGYGIISGWTGTGEEKITAQQLPAFYEKLGFSYGTFRGLSADQTPWDFSAFRPDVVVINLGTNDDSYTLGIPEREAEYRSAYANFLKVVRRNNPDAVILCALGVMGDRLHPAMVQAAADHTAETGDDRVHTLHLDEQLEADGRTCDYHPTALTHRKAADRLAEEIRQVTGWRD